MNTTPAVVYCRPENREAIDSYLARCSFHRLDAEEERSEDWDRLPEERPVLARALILSRVTKAMSGVFVTDDVDSLGPDPKSRIGVLSFLLSDGIDVRVDGEVFTQKELNALSMKSWDDEMSERLDDLERLMERMDALTALWRESNRDAEWYLPTSRLWTPGLTLPRIRHLIDVEGKSPQVVAEQLMLEGHANPRNGSPWYPKNVLEQYDAHR